MAALARQVSSAMRPAASRRRRPFRRLGGRGLLGGSGLLGGCGRFGEEQELEGVVAFAAGPVEPTQQGIEAVSQRLVIVAFWPHQDGDLGRALQWISTAHVRRYHKHYHSSGHVWQGRFKAFPIEEDDHLLTVLRYVERNPVRAELVARAQDWGWSSVCERDAGQAPAWLEVGPVPRPKRWLEWVNRPLTEGELARVRLSVVRGSPYGSDDWVTQAALRLGLEHTLRPRGRPRKKPEIK